MAERLEEWAYETLGWVCRKLSAGGHFYGPEHFDSLFQAQARTCRFCKSTLLLPPKEAKR